jgi:hypothetical protein
MFESLTVNKEQSESRDGQSRFFTLTSRDRQVASGMNGEGI